jgi:hypothetical protein
VGIFQNKGRVVTVSTKGELRLRIRQFTSEIKSMSKILELLRVSFALRDELYMSMEAISSISYMKIKLKEVINSYFVFFLYTTAKLRKYLGFEHGS